MSSSFQTPVLDFNNQLLAPGGKGTWGSWGKGSSGGTSAKPAESGKFSKLLNSSVDVYIFIDSTRVHV